MRYYVLRKKIFHCCMFLIILMILLHPDRNARGAYEFIEKENILSSLREELANNFSSTAIADCDYYDVINDDSTLTISIAEGDLIEGHRIKDGGEYAPIECKPKYSTAIVAPYREKAEQLRGFLVYLHMFLRRQNIHYRVYVVEQVDSKPFNRAKLMNIGALYAMRDGYPCLILHDLNLLPLRPANLYACTKQARHMSSSINKYRFVLPHLNILDGVMSITPEQFKEVNGMSNKYFGLDGAEDDLFIRLKSRDIKVSRFEPKISQYSMVSRQKIVNGENLLNVEESMSSDGLNSLKYTEVAVVLHPLFTHIMVDL